jgi:hypothetical protein
MRGIGVKPIDARLSFFVVPGVHPQTYNPWRSQPNALDGVTEDGGFDQAPLERWQSVSLRRWTHAMICKTDKIRAAWAVGDRVGALRIAARFFDRSDDTKAFKRGIDAFNNPRFYRQLGKEPEQITQDTLETLANRFGLPFR